MAVPKIGFTQSTDGKTLTLIDQSTLDAPITNYTRVVELWSGINGTGTLLTSLTFSVTDMEVDHAITADRYFSAKLIHTGAPTVVVAYANFTTQGFEQNVINGLLKASCGCGDIKNCDRLTLGFIYMTQSQIATMAGNSGLANSFIQSSFKMLTY